MQVLIDILSTRELEEAAVDVAFEKGINIEVLPFIRTEAIESVEIQQEVELALLIKAIVVFTSANAVDAVYGFITDEQPAWNIYCIGSLTSEKVKNYFPFSNIVGTADNAKDLAEMMIEEVEGAEVIFFCGDMRRDELPDMLREHLFELNEIVVYQTIAVPHKIKKKYNAVMFFSPSGVDSFFEMNKLAAEIPLFAIGNTTAMALKKKCTNKVLTPTKPSKEELVEKVIEYFT